MWNESSDKEALEARLHADPPLRERVEILLGLAHIAKRDADESAYLLSTLRDLIPPDDDSFRHERAHLGYLEQFTVGEHGGRAEAVARCREVLAEYVEMGDVYGQCRVLLSLTNYANAAGNHHLARTHVERIRDLADAHDLSADAMALMYHEFANTYLSLGLLDLAETYATRSMNTATHAFQALWILSEIEIRSEQFAEALGYTEQAYRVALDLGIDLWVTLAETRIGRCLRGLGRYGEAIELLEAALDRYDTADMHYANAAVELGRVFRDEGSLDRAQTWLVRALDVFGEEHWSERSRTMRALADVYGQLGRYRDAFTLMLDQDELATRKRDEAQREQVASLAAQYEYQLSQRDLELAQLRNRTLAAQNTMLEQAYEEQAEILGIVAHDLNNPLSALIFTTSNLIEMVGNSSEAQLLSRISSVRSVAQHMVDITSQLTAVNLIDSDNLQVSLRTVDLREMVEDAIGRQQQALEQKGVTVDLTDPSGPVLVDADELLLQQVLLNLLSNSIKYSATDSTVKIDVTSEGDEVAVTFTDQGVGMDPAEMDRLFTKFGRLSARPTANETSTGLGLYIVAKYVEKMGGDVEADSPGLGRGSTFAVRFRRGKPQFRVA